MFTQKYWWLRSPGTDNLYGSSAWYVRSYGDIIYGSGYVNGSYGERSPDLENDDNTAWYVRSRGSVDYSLDYGYTSYGFL